MCYDHIVSSFSASRVQELFKKAPTDVNTPEKMAKVTGIPIKVIEEMQKGDYEPTLHVAYKLAAAFDVPLDKLFADDNTTTSTGKGNC